MILDRFLGGKPAPHERFLIEDLVPPTLETPLDPDVGEILDELFYEEVKWVTKERFLKALDPNEDFEVTWHVIRKFLKVHFPFKIVDRKNRRIYLSGNQSLSNVLCIEDPLLLQKKLNGLYGFAHKPRSGVDGRGSVYYTFSDMTKHDVIYWEDYFDRRRSELEKGPISPIRSLQTFEAQGERICSIQHFTSQDVMEAWYEIQVKYWDQGREDDSPLICADFRYGRSSEKEAVVYAVQGAKIGTFSYQQALEVSKAMTKHEAVLLTYLPEEYVDEVTDERGNVLRDRMRALATKVRFDWSLDEKSASGLSKKAMDSLGNYDYLYGWTGALVKGALESHEKDRAEIKKIRKGFNEGVKGRLRTVPPHTYISFLLGIRTLFVDGVRRVQIPMNYPYRAHQNDPDLDHRITRSKLLLAQRFMMDFSGVSSNVNDFSQEKCPDYLVMDFDAGFYPVREFAKGLWYSREIDSSSES